MKTALERIEPTYDSLTLDERQEYENAAAWCAARGLPGIMNDTQRPPLSARVLQAIYNDGEDFERMVRLEAYALAHSSAA